MDTYILKRDGKQEPFSIDKIKNAISKAFIASNSFATEETLSSLLARLRIHNGISVEEIQNQVEVALMAERYYTVAKNYMIYRYRHTKDRETLEKLDFLISYCSATNAATGSKYDANANVEKKNIATLIGELPKSNYIRLNRRMLCDRIEKMYGKELADKYITLLKQHFIYKNDETSLANYCASITMYPWLLEGTKPIGGNATAPTNLKSFCGGFINMVFMVSSMLSGACATPEFLMYMNYFIEQEYGEDYYLRADEVVDLSKKRRTIDKVITDCFQQVVYSINQPSGARTSSPSFGISVITTATISRVSSASFVSRTATARIGSRSTGCNSVSCAGSTPSVPMLCSPSPSRPWHSSARTAMSRIRSMPISLRRCTPKGTLSSPT